MLKYRNEDDRAYGLAGMAISAASLDALDKIISFSIDSPETMVTFTQDYYFGGSPAISPKSTWDNLVSNFFITSSMIISNVLSRSIVRDGESVPDETLKIIRSEIIEEGKDSCSLEDDEVEQIYNQSLSRSRRIFLNTRLHPAVHELARVFSRERTLSTADLYEQLRMLQLI